MSLKKSIPIVITSVGIASLSSVSQAQAAGHRSCNDVLLHADKLTRQAQRYQQRAAQLRPGEHDKYIVALKRRAISMRSKAIALVSSCTIPHSHQGYHY